MPGWFDSAARVFGRGGPAAPPEATPFVVSCRCGRRLEGERQKRYQSLPCPGCGEAVFVLGVDVYPRPKPKKPKKPRQSAERTLIGEASDVEEELTPLDFVEEQDAAPPLPRTGARRQPPPDRPDAPGKPTEKSPEAPSANRPTRRGLTAEDLQWGAPAEPLGQRLVRFGHSVRSSLRRQVTPVRLLAVAALAAVALTATLAWRSQAREAADILLRTRKEVVESLLSEGRPVDLEAELRNQTAACALLGRTDDDALRLEALLRETIASNRLLPGSLFELLAEASRSAEGSPAEWEAEFERRYRGKWVVVDSPLVRTTTAAGESLWLVDAPLEVGGKPVRIEGDLEGLAPLTEGGRPVLFAGQLDALRLPTPDAPEFVLVLAPETAFPWHRAESLPFVGLDDNDPEAAKILAVRMETQRKAGAAPDRVALLRFVERGLPPRVRRPAE